MLSSSACNHTGDKQIELSLIGRPILLSLVWLQTELDTTQSYYHYLSSAGFVREAADRINSASFYLHKQDNMFRLYWFDSHKKGLDRFWWRRW